MKYIKKRYRLLYLIPLSISVIAFCIMHITRFIMSGNLPQSSMIDIDIEGINGEFYKIYRKDNGDVFIGEKVKLDK